MQSHIETPHHTEHHLTQQDHLTEIMNNQSAEFGAGVFDTVTLTAIFSMFLTTSTQVFLQETGRFFLFPFAALANILRATFAWRQAYLEKFKQTDTIVRATVETLVTVAITFAVVASLAATAIFGGFISPVIFAVTLGLKSLFQVASAGFYYGKSNLTKDKTLKNNYRAAARDNAVAALSTILATTAVILVFVFAKPLMAPFGIAAGIVGVALTAHGVYQGLRSKNGDFDSDSESDEEEEEVLINARETARPLIQHVKRGPQHSHIPVTAANNSSYHSMLTVMSQSRGSVGGGGEEEDSASPVKADEAILSRSFSSPANRSPAKTAAGDKNGNGLDKLPLLSVASDGRQSSREDKAHEQEPEQEHITRMANKV